MIVNFIKGIFVGIFNIVPGLSGSILLIILNLYDKCIITISNILKDFKKSMIFLLPIGLGIILGTYLFSKIIFFFLHNYETTTLIVFTGFIFGTIPHLIKEASKKGFKNNYIIPFLVALFIGITLLFFKTNAISYSINYDIESIIKYFAIGIVLSLTTIIPGISGTIVLSIFGLYGIYIYSLSTLNLIVLIPIIIGFTITTFFLSKLINYLLKNYYGYTYFAILGFTIATIPGLISFNLTFNLEFIISIILGIIAFIITYESFNYIKKKE